MGVEGSHDISFLKNISNVLRSCGRDVPELDRLERIGQIIFFPLGGSNLALWTSRLRHLNRPEYHICDRDNGPPAAPKYAGYVEAVNARDKCRAVSTTKREMENYLHPGAIREAYQEMGHKIVLPKQFEAFDDVPVLVAQAVHDTHGAGDWGDLSDSKRGKKEKNAKKILNNRAVARMTVARLTETDPDCEMEGWLKEIGQMVELSDQ